MAEIKEAKLTITPSSANQHEVKVDVIVVFGTVEIALMNSLQKENKDVELFAVMCDILGGDGGIGRGEDDLLFRIQPTKFYPREGLSPEETAIFTQVVPSRSLNEDRGGRVRGRDEIYAYVRVDDIYTKRAHGIKSNRVDGRF